MSLSRFVRPVRYRAVAGNLCLMLRLLGFLLTIPLAVSLLAREFHYSAVLGGLAAAAFGIGMLGRRLGEFRLDGTEALIVTGLAYPLFAFFGALAFLRVAPFWNGFFESISGFTTTGLSVLNPDSLPASLLFFRSYSQWVGGLGIVLLTLIVLQVPGQEVKKLYVQEFGRENPLGDIKKTARTVLAIYGSITGAGWLALLLSGLAPFEALLMIMATISTGGFAPHARSVGYYPGPAAQLTVIVFMILGAVGFPFYAALFRRGWKGRYRDSQAAVLLALGAGAAVLFLAAWHGTTRMILPSLFHSFSALTTTGFSTVSFSEWTPLLKGLSVILMMIGGASYSTAGGIKLFRFITLLKLIRWSVARRVLPQAASIPMQSEGKPVSTEDLKDVLSLFAIYAVILSLSSLIFMLSGYAPDAAVFENASAMGTVGLSSGITSAGLPLPLKLVLIFNMWAGRLEIFPVIIIFLPAVWLNRRTT
jgi:trk system potassium uptake protein TrkH